MHSLLASLVVVQLIALMMPGPDFFFVTRTAVSQSRGKAILGVLGITVGCGVSRLSERHELEKPERLDGVGLFTVLDLELK